MQYNVQHWVHTNRNEKNQYLYQYLNSKSTKLQ